MFSLTCAWINGWVNNNQAGDLTRHRADYDVTVMVIKPCLLITPGSLPFILVAPRIPYSYELYGVTPNVQLKITWGHHHMDTLSALLDPCTVASFEGCFVFILNKLLKTPGWSEEWDISTPIWWRRDYPNGISFMFTIIAQYLFNFHPNVLGVALAQPLVVIIKVLVK